MLLNRFIPSIVYLSQKTDDVDSLKKSLNINDSNVVFVYSGNLQKWQNFELMIQCIRAMNNPNYRFIIMTQEEERANEIVSNCQIQILS